MQSLSTQNTSSERRLSNVVAEDEHGRQEGVLHNEIQATNTVVASESTLVRARRGRSKRKSTHTEASAAESSQSGAVISTSSSPNQAGSSVIVTELDLALEALSRKVRASTAMIYRMPLEHWKNFCDKERNRYPVDPQYPYTVGPTEFVVAFFEEFVFKRTHYKSVSMETDVRLQIGLQTGENEDNQMTLLQMAENAPASKNGQKKLIQVPLGIEAVKQYKKVLIFLYNFQAERRRMEWPSPSKAKQVIELIKKYENDLVYDQVQTNADRAAHCVIRDSYKPGELIRILKSLWASSSQTALREMFSISARHHMLLRDQDLRNLNFADCFCTIIPKKQHKGIQQAVALVFSLDKGKTLKEGEVKFACAMRHENLLRCPFSAFAFFMFSLLQDSGDFLKEDRWHNWKVLRGRGDPEKSLSGVSQWKTAKNALLNETIFTTRVTHGGRHAGAMEAEALGMPIDLIKRGGGWKDRLGRLETHYLGKLPSQFARGMAGFWEKPFGLSRNVVSPPVELQRLVFPWIETYFGENNSEWVSVCNREMQEVDENEDEDENMINLEVNEEPLEFVEEDGTMVANERRRKGKQRAVQSSIDTAKRGFLRLLIRCRRIILQDAAVYLHLNKKNRIVNLQSRIFSTTMFKMFQEDVVAAITSPSVGRLEEYESLVPNILDTHRQVASRVAEINHRIVRLQQQQNHRFESNENAFQQFVEQSNRNNTVLINTTQQLARDVKILMMQQQCLNSQMQLLLATNNPLDANVNGSHLYQASTISPAVFAPQHHLPSLPSNSAEPTSLPSVQQPVTISPAPSVTRVNASIAGPSQSRQNKKIKWINYDPSGSN